MQKNLGRSQQIRGQKRHVKNLLRKQRKEKNTMYLVKLMQKYGIDLKLNEKPKPGDIYFSWYLNNRGNEETTNG